MIIAIDGTAASGKGTAARRLAAKFGWAYLDTGTLYRAVGLSVLRQGGDPSDETAAAAAARSLDIAVTEDPEIRSGASGAAASKVAAIGDVRAALLQLQRDFAASPPNGETGAVLDGRDIGTVVCPDANMKVWIDADVEVRAERRFKELKGRGEPVIYARVLEDLKGRDARDAGRKDAPMVRAADALVVDTSALTPDEVFDRILAALPPGM